VRSDWYHYHFPSWRSFDREDTGRFVPLDLPRVGMTIRNGCR
jgi:hypothetical protein